MIYNRQNIRKTINAKIINETSQNYKIPSQKGMSLI